LLPRSFPGDPISDNYCPAILGLLSRAWDHKTATAARGESALEGGLSAHLAAAASHSLGWHRRIGRKALTLIKPVFAPLLNRLQLRLQTAIDQSSGRLAENVVARMESLRIGLNEVTTRVEALQTVLYDAATHVEVLQTSLDALRLDQKENYNTILQTINDQKTLVEAIRTDQEENSKLLTILMSRADHLVRCTTLLEAIRTEQAENPKLLAMLMSRADSLLQRVTIPLGGDVLVRTPEGFLLLPSEDPTTVSAVWESGGRLEPGTIKVLAAVLREGDYVIDVGANIGLIVLPAARIVGPEGRVIAVEPASRAGSLLRKTLALNFVSDRVLFYPYAAGEIQGKARLNIGQIIGHSSLLSLQGSEYSEEVEVRSVDSLVPHGQAIRLVKLDAEGFEPQVWRGMRRIVTENPDLIVLVEFGPEHLRRAGISAEDWLTEFQAPGFTAYEVDEMTGHVRPLRPVAELASVYSLNLLLLRQPPAAFPELHFE
jgi:FkbM family methyltransferase